MASTPSSITGGCLCGSIRYTVTFPADHDFSKAATTCQCTDCRKQTGSLIFRVHAVPVSSVSFTSQSTPSTLSEFRASPPCIRGFCTTCGSLLFWRDEREDVISLTVGCFDKAVLKEHGRLLTEARVHLWCRDEIEGVTDHLVGERWAYSNEGEGAELMKS